MSTATFWFVNSVQPEMGMETQVIARGLRQKDPEVLDGLIEKYQYRLFRYLLRLTGHRETAEDLFQETWIRVLERGQQYDGKSKFEPWLFRIARNLVIDHQRRRQPRFLDLLDGRTSEETWLDIQPSKEPSALEIVSRQETSKQLEAGLAQVPAPYREVVMLRFQEEMPLLEIAEVVSAPLATVKSRLYRGLEAMRQLLEGGKA